jgi:hypothetical protein
VKYLLVFFLLIPSVFADCTTTSSEEVVTEETEIRTDVPNHLRGATITVKLANGTESTVPAERFKVVPRLQQFLVAKTQKNTETMCRNFDKNRVSVVGGRGPKSNLVTNTAPGVTEVSTDVGFVGGLQYQRMLNETWSLGVQGQSNKTGSLLLGLDF